MSDTNEMAGRGAQFKTDGGHYRRPVLRGDNERLKVDAMPLADGRAKASADNNAATATIAAPDAGYRWGVTHVSASFSASATADKLLQITEDNGGTPVVLWEGYISGNGRSVDFNPALAVTAAKSISAVLAASGSGGQIGKVNIVAVRQKA